MRPRTTGYLVNFPAMFVPSTFLWALHRLMNGVIFLSGTKSTCYVSKHTMVYDEGE